MTEDELGKAKALQAIGAYLCAYSEAAYELGETLKVLFKITNNEMADAIVASLGDFARQATLARALCQDARNVDGTELSEQRKEQIDKTISNCYTCNDDRVKLAHGRLEPRADGSVAIVHVKVDRGGVKGKDPVIWSLVDWSNKTSTLTKLADELRNFQNELKTLKIPVPAEAALGWLTRWDDSSVIVHRRQISQARWDAIGGGSSWVPKPPDDPE